MFQLSIRGLFFIFLQLLIGIILNHHFLHSLFLLLSIEYLLGCLFPDSEATIDTTSDHIISSFADAHITNLTDALFQVENQLICVTIPILYMAILAACEEIVCVWNKSNNSNSLGVSKYGFYAVTEVKSPQLYILVNTARQDYRLVCRHVITQYWELMPVQFHVLLVGVTVKYVDLGILCADNIFVLAK